jgi:hypothetical protein
MSFVHLTSSRSCGLSWEQSCFLIWDSTFGLPKAHISHLAVSYVQGLPKTASSAMSSHSTASIARSVHHWTYYKMLSYDHCTNFHEYLLPVYEPNWKGMYWREFGSVDMEYDGSDILLRKQVSSLYGTFEAPQWPKVHLKFQVRLLKIPWDVPTVVPCLFTNNTSSCLDPLRVPHAPHYYHHQGWR